MMARQYRLIWRVKEFSPITRDQEMARVLRMSPWNVKKLMDQGKVSVSFLREAILNVIRPIWPSSGAEAGRTY
jgi:hypothetical protein